MAAQQGHVSSQHNTGFRYNQGKGCEQSHERAAEWSEKAALQGYATAMNMLGCLYLDGLGREQSNERAVEWLEKPHIEPQMCTPLKI